MKRQDQVQTGTQPEDRGPGNAHCHHQGLPRGQSTLEKDFLIALVAILSDTVLEFLVLCSHCSLHPQRPHPHPRNQISSKLRWESSVMTGTASHTLCPTGWSCTGEGQHPGTPKPSPTTVWRWAHHALPCVCSEDLSSVCVH